MTEFKIHVAIINHLRGNKKVGNKLYASTKPFPKLFCFHVYQGRSKDEGFFLKMLGVWPGIADICCIWKLPTGFDIAFLEVKTEQGRLSSAQIKFKGICLYFGIKWAMVRSVQEAHDRLKNWGVECVHSAITEAELHTFEDNIKAVHDMYKP